MHFEAKFRAVYTYFYDQMTQEGAFNYLQK
jgi:hypothetical protein